MVKLIAKNIQNHFNNFKLKYSLKKKKKDKLMSVEKSSPLTCDNFKMKVKQITNQESNLH